MSDIELVIKIPTELYEECKRLGDSRDTLFEAIRHGTLLPKYTLISRQLLKHRLYEKYMDNPAEFKKILDVINELPTIQEAKGEVNGV